MTGTAIATDFAEVNGTSIHYAILGNGPAVVLLHGWPYTWIVWRPLIPVLAQHGFTVIAPDLRGLGGSRRESDGYAKQNVASDIRELAASLGFDEIDLVGIDIGAMVALTYAIDTPNRVRHLVLGESLLPGFGLEELMDPATGGFWHFGFHMQVEVATMLTSGHEAAYLSPGWEGFSRGLTEADRAELLREYTGQERSRRLLALRNAARRWEAQPRTPNSPLPMSVLVLNGEQGLPQPPLLAGVQRVAQNVQADIVPNAAHTIGADNPEWVAIRLSQFFSTTAR